MNDDTSWTKNVIFQEDSSVAAVVTRDPDVVQLEICPVEILGEPIYGDP